MEDGRVLPAGASRDHGGWARSTYREADRRLAGRAFGVWPTAALGSPARRTGPRPSPFGGGRWRAVDLECGAGPLAGGHRVAGFLSCQPAPLGLGPGVTWRGRRRHRPVGRAPPPPTAAWPGTTPLDRVGGPAGAARRGGQGGPARTELFRHPGPSAQLSGTAPTRLAHWLWGGRIRVPQKTMRVKPPRPILHPKRNAPSQRFDRTPPQPPLGGTLELQLIGGSVKMRPSAFCLRLSVGHWPPPLLRF